VTITSCPPSTSTERQSARLRAASRDEAVGPQSGLQAT
jgi:hypothetical protein